MQALGLRITPDVPSNRKVNFVLSRCESAEYSPGPHGTSVYNAVATCGDLKRKRGAEKLKLPR